MTETTNTPFSGLMVKARKMPDFMYPRYEKWYNTSTYISESVTTYLGHPCGAGRSFVTPKIAERDWHATAPPVRALRSFDTTRAVDLTTPAYMLAGNQPTDPETFEDTLVGLDYTNVPIRMAKDIGALEEHFDTTVSLGNTLYGRVLAIKHKFTFSNFSRFPLEVFWAILPVGHLWPAPVGSFVPHADIMSTNFSKIVIPAVRDANDRSQKRTIDVAMNLKKLWPMEYNMRPGVNMSASTAAGSANESNSPWFALHDSQTSGVIRNFPPGQLADDSKSTPDPNSSGPTCGLRLQWFAKLQNPRDLGFTTEDADHAGGDFSGNNYDVHANMSWLVDIMRVGLQPAIHPGEKAYPSVAT